MGFEKISQIGRQISLLVVGALRFIRMNLLRDKAAAMDVPCLDSLIDSPSGEYRTTINK